MGNFRVPAIQLQLNPEDPWGPYNCAAYSGGMIGDADSRGKLVYTGMQVRAHSSEPRPNSKSPGLTVQQVDASLFELSNGHINLDVHGTGSPFAAIPPALRAGKWALVALWRGVIVDAGFGGSSTFREAHASAAGYDQVRKKPILLDPLTNHVLDVPWTVLERAMRMLMIHWGKGGGAYFALTRDVFDEAATVLRYSALFEAQKHFFTYRLSQSGVILGRDTGGPFAEATSAPCTAPALKPWPAGGSRKLVQVTKGPLDGVWLEPGTTGVRLKVTK